MDADRASSSYILIEPGVEEGERSEVFFPSPVPWQPSTMTCSWDSSVRAEEISWAEIWGVSRPIVMLVVGWGIGLASGALGLVWLLR